MHYYGDDWPHWDELGEAHLYIQDCVYKYSLCRLISKEKWGTIRYEYIYPPGCRSWWFSVKLPFKRKTKWGDLDVYLFNWPDSWLYYKWMSYGGWTLKRAIAKACLKFPNVVKEISVDI